MKTTFSIVGCGKVGVTLAWHLAHIGFVPAGFASRRSASAHAAAEAAEGGKVCRHAWEATMTADLVFITTPDAVIAPMVEQLAAHKGFKPGAIVLHCSGALSSTIMAPARRSKAHTGSLHPLQSFAAPTFPDNPFRGVVMAAEGDAAALAMARKIAGGLKAEYLPIETENKTLYHAAAVVASNYLVTLLHSASKLLAGSGIASDAALHVLLPLVRGTLGNIEKQGIVKALTGPIARGDQETVAVHSRRIGQVMPDELPLYRLLGRHTLPLAAQRGDVDAETLRALEDILTSSGGGPVSE